MGANTWMLVCSKGNPVERLKTHPVLDRDATIALARQLFPREKMVALDDGDLSNTCPPGGEIVIGCFNGISIVAAKEFGVDTPSSLPARFIEAFPGHRVVLHAMHSVVDWFAYAVWNDGTLQRALSLSPDSGVLEDIGDRLPFEAPYWAGDHPAFEPDEDDAEYPFVFHPLELGEAALVALFGYQIEGMTVAGSVAPETIRLMRLKRKKSWWRFG